MQSGLSRFATNPEDTSMRITSAAVQCSCGHSFTITRDQSSLIEHGFSKCSDCTRSYAVDWATGCVWRFINPTLAVMQ